jgi:hypothetical protein
LFRPASIRLSQAIPLHFGPQTALTADPPTVSIDPRNGGSLEVVIRNNSLEIQTYRVEASGPGLDFLPPSVDVAVGAIDERPVPLRVFVPGGAAGMRDWHLRVTGGASVDLPMRVLSVPRDGTVAWTADLDGDGSPEWILESRQARAVFSAQDGGRWMDFTWKDANANFLPEQGVFAAPGPVEVKADGDVLEFTGRGWKRTVRLAGGVLTVEQTTPLPPEQAVPGKRGNATLTVERSSPMSATYTLK